jgi:hypothetical protein
MALQFSRSQVEDILADVHMIEPSKRAAFSARMRHLQRLEFPAGTNVGKGRRAAYGFSEIVLLAVAFELLQLGITPERIVSILGSQPNPKHILLVMASTWMLRDLGNRKVLMFNPTSLMGLGPSPLSSELHPQHNWQMTTDFTIEQMFDTVGSRGAALINADKLMEDLALAAARHPDVGVFKGADLPGTDAEMIAGVAPVLDRWADEHV